MADKHQSIIDAEAMVADKDAENIRYRTEATPARQFIQREIYTSIAKPIQKGWLNKTYRCPVHPDVILHTKVVKHKYKRHEWIYTRYYDGCGYEYWSMHSE